MAGRLLLDDGFNRQVELSQEIHGSGAYVETSQIIASFTFYDAVTLFRVSSERDTITLNISFNDIETLYAALKEYQQHTASLSSDPLADLDEHPF